jgi:hypothetical protein
MIGFNIFGQHTLTPTLLEREIIVRPTTLGRAKNEGRRSPLEANSPLFLGESEAREESMSVSHRGKRTRADFLRLKKKNQSRIDWFSHI